MLTISDIMTFRRYIQPFRYLIESEMPIRKLSLVFFSAIAVSACQKTNVTGVSDAQTVEYFSKSPELAKAVAYKCIDFEKKDYSKLTAEAQKDWQNTTDGINCRNARTAATTIVVEEQQRIRSEASRKYSVDAVKK